MDFNLTEDRRMLADSLARYLAHEYGFPIREQIARSETGWSQEKWAQFAQMGVIGALFAEADGGYGGAGFDLALVFESLGRALVVEPFLGTLMAGCALAAAGRQEELERAIGGSRLFAWAHQEAEGGYEPHYVATTARRVGEGWVLDGAKAVVEQGEAAHAYVVSARVDGAIDAEEGIALFLVPRDAENLCVAGCPNIDGGRSVELTLQQVKLPASALLLDDARDVVAQAQARGIVALCAEAVGAMEMAKAATLEYLQTRKQFGVPIGSFQALQHRMADLALEIEQARSALINAAAALERNGSVRDKAISAAKYTIGRVGTLVAEETIQLHGGIGMSWELPLPHYAKRLVMIDHQLGDEDFHLARYMALSAENSAQ
ncbi:MAG TPA: acyl-CoA dehydrogenase family protein [Burkholderiaceae bacterium]